MPYNLQLYYIPKQILLFRVYFRKYYELLNQKYDNLEEKLTFIMQTIQLRKEAAEAKRRAIENERIKAFHADEASRGKAKLAELEATLVKKEVELEEQAKSIQEENDRMLLNQFQEWQDELDKEKKKHLCTVC